MLLSADEPVLQPTGDGSHTLFSPRFGQQYHDTNGAIDESRHVFLEQGTFLQRLERNEDIHIFEMGFGTGLNLLLVAEALTCSGSSSRIVFTTIEGFPISPETAAKLNYSDLLQYPKNLQLAEIFASAKPGLNRFEILPNLELRLFIGMYADFNYDALPINCIFFDAFSPKANPELWTASVFDDIYNHAATDAVLATYCAAVSARAAMCHAGWFVARGPGCKTRREMTVAAKDPSQLGNLPRVNEIRYKERYAAGEFASSPQAGTDQQLESD